MKPTTQPGTHPDAELLAAFSERQVTDTEREEILAHMAVCSRCREVVFLAQKAMEADEPPSHIQEAPERKRVGGWFANWRLAWIPVAALAGVVGVAVLEHERHATVPQTQMAKNAGPAETTPQTSGAIATPHPTPLQSREKPKSKIVAPAREDRDMERDRRLLDSKDASKTAQKKDEAVKEADSLRQVPPPPSGGALHGTFEARAKSSSVGGPLAQNQMQVQNNAQLQQQQNYSNEVQKPSALSDSANKPVSSVIQSGVSSQTVEVQESGGPVPVAPVPAAAPAVSASQLETENADLAGNNLAKDKGGKPPLPSNLGVLSKAKSGKTIIAIDSAGAVFLSEDAGKHWQTVDPRWTGRPVLVKQRSSLGAMGGLLKQSTPRFEMTTDKHEMWVSEDGKTWTPEPLTR
ncbi:MAG: hypothetical protein JST28_12515 [Acidobacteria bacterium]|nr:hypothetical protein [Acidobacteriota bacterium]